MKFLKKFNQNFLINYSYLNFILKFVKPELKVIYFEIGFGSGNLSKNIILNLSFYNILLYFIEIDNYFFIKFNKIYKKNIINFNIFNFNFFFFKKFFYFKYKLYIIGNIAFNISSNLLFYLIKFIKYINNQFFMLEDKYFNKNINSVTYLSILIKSFYKIKKIFHIKKNFFFPKPNINSVFINFKPLYLSLINISDFYFFKKFIKYFLKNKNKLNNIINISRNDIYTNDKLNLLFIKKYILIFYKFKKKFIKF
ncbi:Ribosomal RNA small subunit methyltransferase A [Candidatus Nasuia deltocephalinicola]|nr:Ribosomal RNA small subunit methyltransferase A [Candidatus Nasuia deltocephalinicola]